MAQADKLKKWPKVHKFFVNLLMGDIQKKKSFDSRENYFLNGFTHLRLRLYSLLAVLLAESMIIDEHALHKPHGDHKQITAHGTVWIDL